MDDVIERLRGTKLEAASETFQAGVLRGRKWAEARATAQQLEQLQASHARMNESGELQMIFSSERFGLFVAHEWLFFLIEPHNHGNQVAAVDFWEAAGVGKHERENLDFVRGFSQGAIALWESVRGKL